MTADVVQGLLGPSAVSLIFWTSLGCGVLVATATADVESVHSSAAIASPADGLAARLLKDSAEKGPIKPALASGIIYGSLSVLLLCCLCPAYWRFHMAQDSQVRRVTPVVPQTCPGDGKHEAASHRSSDKDFVVPSSSTAASRSRSSFDTQAEPEAERRAPPPPPKKTNASASSGSVGTRAPPPPPPRNPKAAQEAGAILTTSEVEAMDCEPEKAPPPPPPRRSSSPQAARAPPPPPSRPTGSPQFTPQITDEASLLEVEAVDSAQSPSSATQPPPKRRKDTET